MKFHWTNRHTSYLCLGLLALIGGVLLYFKVRRFRHYINEEIEQATPETPNNMEQPAVAYDTSVRGYRNNNPLNIRISSNNWKGEIKPSADGSFCQFTTSLVLISDSFFFPRNGRIFVRMIFSFVFQVVSLTLGLRSSS